MCGSCEERQQRHTVPCDRPANRWRNTPYSGGATCCQRRRGKGETGRTESTSLMKIRKKNENHFGTKGTADPVAPINMAMRSRQHFSDTRFRRGREHRRKDASLERVIQDCRTCDIEVVPSGSAMVLLVETTNRMPRTMGRAGKSQKMYRVSM